MAAAQQVKVAYCQLGKSGLRVSVPILGAMSFGSARWGTEIWGNWVLEEEEALPILKHAWDRGINTFDTANVYSNGESERIIGKFVKKYNIPRHEIVIATKCFALVAKEPETVTQVNPHLVNERDYVNQSGLSRAAIFNAVDASLARLDTPYIDLLQIHRFDPKTPAAETMKALHDLVLSGRVRYLGASSMRAWQFAHLNEVARTSGWTEFVSMQNEYSLLYREEEREMNAYCNFHGIGLIPWSPLAAGVLARPVGVSTTRSSGGKGTAYERKSSEADNEIVKRVEEIATKKGRKMAEIALAWAGSKVTSPIVGANKIERVDDSIITDLELTEEEIAYLEEPYVPKPTRGFA